jgi:hypothetical protein
VNIKPNGMVEVWDKGPPPGDPERGKWLREHRGPVVLEMPASDANHSVAADPRYSFEEPK